MLGLWLEHKLRSVTALNIHFVSNRYRSTHIYKCIPVRYIADSYPGEALDSIRVYISGSTRQTVRIGILRSSMLF